MFCNSRCFCLSLPPYPSLAQFSFLNFLIIFINFVPSFSLSSHAFVLICYKVFSFSFFAFAFYRSDSHPFLPYVFFCALSLFSHFLSHFAVIFVILFVLHLFLYGSYRFPRYAIFLCPTKDVLLGFPPSGL